MRLIAKYKGVVGADILLAKALMMSEVSQMSKSEVRMREFLLASWSKLQNQAVKKAVQLAVKLESPEKIAREIDAIMEPWAQDVTPVVSEEMERIFALALQVGHKKATQQTKRDLNYDLPKTKETQIEKAAGRPTKVVEMLPDFTLADERAIDELKGQQVFWIGEHYKKVSPRIQDTSRRVMLEAGGSSLKAGRSIQAEIDKELSKVVVPGGFRGTKEQYFEALSANAATNARVHGQMRSFMSVGVQTYKISAINDKRTCERCSHMNGKVFETSQGATQMQNVLDAETPEQAKKAHPWLSHKELKKISATPGQMKGAGGASDAKKLASAGMAMPPFHFKCRCTVDISNEIRSYDQLTPMSPPSPKPKPKSKLRPKTPAPAPKRTAMQQKMDKHEGLAPFNRVSLKKQVSYRMEEEAATIRKAIDEELARVRNELIKDLKEVHGDNWESFIDDIMPRRLSMKDEGAVIEKVFRDEIKVTKGREYTRGGGQAQMELNRKARREANEAYGDSIKALSRDKEQKVYEMGFEYVDDRIYERVKGRMPAVFETDVSENSHIEGAFFLNKKGVAKNGRHDRSGIVISNHKRAIDQGEMKHLVKHEFGHFLDTVDSTGEAGVIARNHFAKKGRLKTRDDWMEMEGMWSDPYAGRMYGNSGLGSINKNIMAQKDGDGGVFGGLKDASEFTSTDCELLERNKGGNYTKLALEWRTNPERVGFLKAVLKGRFIK